MGSAALRGPRYRKGHWQRICTMRFYRTRFQLFNDLYSSEKPGVAPGSAVTFFCFAKRKSPKKRRAGFVARRFATVRCVARSERGLTKLALRAQTSPALIRPALRYSPPHTAGAERPQTKQPNTKMQRACLSFLGEPINWGQIRIQDSDFTGVRGAERNSALTQIESTTTKHIQARTPPNRLRRAAGVVPLRGKRDSASGVGLEATPPK